MFVILLGGYKEMQERIHKKTKEEGSDILKVFNRVTSSKFKKISKCDEI